MNELKNELLVNQLVSEWFATCEERNVRLSDQAVRFLRFAPEALIKDPPRSSEKGFSGEEFGPNTEFWVYTGRAILDEALRDNRLTVEMKRREMVSFPTLLRVLADSGHKYLLSIGFKR
jgi:hypothetical protein